MSDLGNHKVVIKKAHGHSVLYTTLSNGCLPLDEEVYMHTFVTSNVHTHTVHLYT